MANAIIDMVTRMGGEVGGEVGDMELRIEAEACGWNWAEINDKIEQLLDAGVLFATFGVDFMGRHEAAVRVA